MYSLSNAYFCKNKAVTDVVINFRERKLKKLKLSFCHISTPWHIDSMLVYYVKY